MSDKIEDKVKFEVIKTDEFGVYAIAATSRGWNHDEIGCQDSSKVYKTPKGEYCALICSDGHSSAKYGREGADAICAVLCETLEELENKGAQEEDVVRFLRGRYGKVELLRRWKEKIIDREKNRADSMLLCEDVRTVVRAYGATLNAFVVTKSYIVGLSVGDGALVGAGADGRLFPVFVDEEDGVSTGRTLSLCNLNPEYICVFVEKRQKCHYLAAFTDGYTKTYDLFEEGNVVSQLIEIYDTDGWRKVQTEICDFMESDDIATIDDDVSFVFAAVLQKEQDVCSEIAVNMKNSLFYGDFTENIPQMGDTAVGVYNVLDESDLYEAAHVVIDAVKELDRPITNPVDEVLLFDQKGHKFTMDSTQLYGQPEQQEMKNRILHPELRIGLEDEKTRNNGYLAGILLKLFEREQVLPFLLSTEWESGQKEVSLRKDKVKFLDEESIRYLERLYQGLCGENDIWSPEKWEEKISFLEEERERKILEKEISQLNEEYERQEEQFEEEVKDYSSEKDNLQQEIEAYKIEQDKWKEEKEKRERQLKEQENELKRRTDKLVVRGTELKEKENKLSEIKKELEKKESEYKNRQKKKKEEPDNITQDKNAWM